MRVHSWGRGQPEQDTIQPGPDYDGDLDKKPRAGQILWIRGLTRLQTQVRNKFIPLKKSLSVIGGVCHLSRGRISWVRLKHVCRSNMIC